MDYGSSERKFVGGKLDIVLLKFDNFFVGIEIKLNIIVIEKIVDFFLSEFKEKFDFFEFGSEESIE